MKNFILFISLSLTFLQADNIMDFAQKQGYETDYQTALNKAKEAKLPVMMLVVSNYCPWCRKLESMTLKNSTIDKKVHTAFIPLIVDKESERYPQGFYVPGVPTIFFIDPDSQNMVGRSFGYKSISDFSKILEKKYK